MTRAALFTIFCLLIAGVAYAGDMLLMGVGGQAIQEPSGLVQLEGGTDILLYEDADRAKLEG